jgi:hypothetical protein
MARAKGGGRYRGRRPPGMDSGRCIMGGPVVAALQFLADQLT